MGKFVGEERDIGRKVFTTIFTAVVAAFLAFWPALFLPSLTWLLQQLLLFILCQLSQTALG